ncbi:MAG: UpxY family transcription antiterminator [Bacteroidetes bacterium]|nr:UpxY family transcription antiterminator [Bacteroidota bacterium]
MTQPIRKWRVLYVRPRYEKKVEQQLLDAAIEVFLPLHETIRQWSDRKKKVVLPLFPGYLFVHVDEKERNTTFEVAGVLKYVHFNGKVAEVRPGLIDSLRILVHGAPEIETTSDRLPLGSEIRIRYGPLAGMKGHLVEYRGNRKVAVVIEAIGQTVMVEVPVAELG